MAQLLLLDVIVVLHLERLGEEGGGLQRRTRLRPRALQRRQLPKLPTYDITPIPHNRSKRRSFKAPISSSSCPPETERRPCARALTFPAQRREGRLDGVGGVKSTLVERARRGPHGGAQPPRRLGGLVQHVRVARLAPPHPQVVVLVVVVRRRRGAHRLEQALPHTHSERTVSPAAPSERSRRGRASGPRA
jgi:hypothetical protein